MIEPTVATTDRDAETKALIVGNLLEARGLVLDIASLRNIAVLDVIDRIDVALKLISGERRALTTTPQPTNVA